MTIDAALRPLRRAARRRRLAIRVLAAAPLIVAVVVMAMRTLGWHGALAVGAVAFLLGAALTHVALRAIDAAWLARRLDRAPQLEDSADLLLRDAASLSTLQRLQRHRLHARLAEGDFTDQIRPLWPWRALGLAWGSAVLAIAMAAWMPPELALTSVADRAAAQVGGADTTRIEQSRLDITPPAYTGLAPRVETSLETRAPEGSRIAWRLRFAAQPQAAALVFHDGSRVALLRDGGEWRGERVLGASALYRIVLDGAAPVADDRLYRLDAIADQPPEVHVIAPATTLTLLEDGQRGWDLAFEASDDYAINAATLMVTLAQGNGENIAFKEQTITLQGEGEGNTVPARHLRYRHRLDLAALGIAQGDDVIVRLAVSDHREPTANTTRSASFILRWPAEASSDSAGIDGIVTRTLPAYFRSQRQIILDTEALVAEQATLSEERVLARADAIGVDQKILRLRYGQFLGEEFESGNAAAGETHETTVPDDEHAQARLDALGANEHKHDEARFGDAGDVTAQFGHTHDHVDAATLLDPQTKAILKTALGEMWQAELHLRQGQPATALPFEYRALTAIKLVQQSTRIYLARVGLELPPVDEARRLTGDRTKVTDRNTSLAAAESGADAVIALWTVLDGTDIPDLDSFDQWLRAHQATVPNALDLLAAADRVRREPACVDCRQQLRGLLWPLLPTPATATELRRVPDAGGRAYLDALDAASVHRAEQPERPR